MHFSRVDLMIYINCQMSANLENNSFNSQMTTLQAKLTQLAFSPHPQNETHSQSQTQRLYFNRSNLIHNLNDVFAKETERNIIISHINSPILLTEKSSPSVIRQSRWSFVDEADQQALEIQKIQAFLLKQGLLQVFNSFQMFRNKMIQSLSEDEGSITTRKLALLQATANLKKQLRDINSSSASRKSLFRFRQDLILPDEIQSYRIQINNLLMQISTLRRQNDKLRQKMNSLAVQLFGNELDQKSLQNSMFNNSISYGNSSLGNSQIIQSFESSLEYYKISDLSPRLCDSARIASKSTTISLQNSAKRPEDRQEIPCKQENILEEESYQATCLQYDQTRQYQKYKQTQDAIIQTSDVDVSRSHKRQQYELISEFVKVTKYLFRNQFETTNLSIRYPQHLDRMHNLFKTYKSFKPTVSDKTQGNFLTQCAKFISLVSSSSEQLAKMIGAEFASVRKIPQP